MKTNTPTQATPRPWRITEMSYDDGLEVQIGSNQRKVAVTRWEVEPIDRENFALIVQAVNQFDALCAVAHAAALQAKYGDTYEGFKWKQATENALQQLEAIRKQS